MVVLYIRDHGDLSFSGQKPASQYHPDALESITKPKGAFWMILNDSNRLLLFLFNGIFY